LWTRRCQSTVKMSNTVSWFDFGLECWAQWLSDVQLIL
jgi:hypothetical protein